MKNKQSVDYLELPVQTRNMLKSHGIKRICDLEALSTYELLGIRGISEYNLSEIKIALDTFIRQLNASPYVLTDDNTIYFMRYMVKNGEIKFVRTRHAVIEETENKLHLSGAEGERLGTFTVCKRRIDHTQKTGFNNYQLLTYEEDSSLFLEDVKQLREIEKEEAKQAFLQEQEKRQVEIDRIAEMIASENEKYRNVR